jgi:hypothetical protein
MYDGNSKSRKYAGILEALTNLISTLLALGHEEFQFWSERLQAIEHENLSILSELLPDIHILTGTVPNNYLTESDSVSVKAFSNAVTALLTIVSQSDVLLVIYLDCIEVCPSPFLLLVG